MEKLLNESITKQLIEMFSEMKRPVTLLFFGSSGENCEYCDQTFQLLEEMSAVSDLVSLQKYDLDQDVETVKLYKIDKTPAIAICAQDGDRLVDYGIRIYGIPAGHEFGTLVHSVVLVANGESGLDADVKSYLNELNKPLNLQVFVTPT
jgi:alkyl hydroperoxide reductase subunit AhpF